MSHTSLNPNAAEGWGLFDVDGSGLLEIQRDDQAGIFATDQQAFAYVCHRAIWGSEPHREAKARHLKDREAIQMMRASAPEAAQ